MFDAPNPGQDRKSGSPAWMTTFADLMSLLMCFFVLLLSFSEMDLQRFETIAGSMKFAFGVQREIKVFDIPAGESIVKQEFGVTTDQPSSAEQMRLPTDDFQKLKRQREAGKARQLQARLQTALAEPISRGSVDVEAKGPLVTVRLREAGIFPSGSADLQPQAYEVLAELAPALSDFPGGIILAGHTDDRPISTARFRDNWDLSAARAASVAQALESRFQIESSRLIITGHADTRPVAGNEDAEQRSSNRRVEILIDVREHPPGSVLSEVRKVEQVNPVSPTGSH